MVKKETAKKITKLDKKTILNDILGEEIVRLKDSCNLKWEQAMNIEQNGGSESKTNRRTKKENTDLREYNQQVRTLADVCTKLAQIQKGDFEDLQEESTEDDELV